MTTKTRKWNHELDVVGLKFRFKRDGRRALGDMIAKRGSITGMKLVREPENPADANAIKVCLPDRVLDGKHIGYIRADSAALLAPKIDSGSLIVHSVKLEDLDAEDDWNTGTLFIVFGDVVRPKRKPAKGKTAKR